MTESYEPDLTVGQIARLAAVSPGTVRVWIERGLLSGYQLPGPGSRRRWRVRPEFVRAFLEKHGMGHRLAKSSKQ